MTNDLPKITEQQKEQLEASLKKFIAETLPVIERVVGVLAETLSPMIRAMIQTLTDAFRPIYEAAGSPYGEADADVLRWVAATMKGAIETQDENF
ncbi:MAG: hypothetical protein KDG50_03150 [Chromatiales bacterium]|nr:hypothetical protein [Chromatiales bacterium]